MLSTLTRTTAAGAAAAVAVAVPTVAAAATLPTQETLTPDELRLVELYRRARDARPTTADFIVNMVGCFAVSAEACERDGLLKRPGAMESGVLHHIEGMIEASLRSH